MAIKEGEFLVGLETVLSNLNREVEKISERTKAGMIRIGLEIKHITLPRTPIFIGRLDAQGVLHPEGGGGNLRGSMYVDPPVKIDGKNYAIIIGFSAVYAVWVHEDMEARHPAPGTEAKFLERTIDENHDLILSILREEAQVA